MLAQYYDILKDLIKFKSISTDQQFAPEMMVTAKFLEKLFQEHKRDVEVVTGYGNPIVLASFTVNKKLPNCLLYGHYDVQFADKGEWWKHDPFSLYLGKDKIYGRGVSDNKWQFLIHLVSLFELSKQNNLCYNVTVILEWEEEVGSAHLQQFLLAYKDRLKADIALVSDSDIIGDTPCIDAGYRGSCNAKLKLTTAHTDVHSGSYGGVFPNAIHEATILISKLFDMNHRITVPYFYYNVEKIDTDILIRNKKMKINVEKIQTDFWVKALLTDKEFDYLTQVGLRPTIQITGIQGGYMGDGFKNAIPATSSIHLNFRLVKNQRVDDVIKAFEQWVHTNMPEYVEYELSWVDKAEASKANMGSIYHKKAENILKEIFGKPVFYKYSWWTLPIVNLFTDILWTESLLVPLANEDCNMHGVNENMDIALVEKWLMFSHAFFAEK